VGLTRLRLHWFNTAWIVGRCATPHIAAKPSSVAAMAITMCFGRFIRTYHVGAAFMKRHPGNGSLVDAVLAASRLSRRQLIFGAGLGVALNSSRCSSQ